MADKEEFKTIDLGDGNTIKCLNDKVGLLIVREGDKKLYGLADLVNFTFIAPAKFDKCEIVEFVEGPAIVHLYDGINCYTSDIRKKDKTPLINDSLSDYQKNLLIKNPHLFLKLDNAFFVDELGKVRTSHIDLMRGLALKGLMLKMNDFGVDKPEIEEKSNMLKNAIAEKIECEIKSKKYKTTPRYHFDNRNTEKAD